MNDDIVKALRDMNRGDFRSEPRVYVSPDSAADEIERLRRQIMHLWTYHQGCGKQTCQLCTDAYHTFRNKTLEDTK